MVANHWSNNGMVTIHQYGLNKCNKNVPQPVLNCTPFRKVCSSQIRMKISQIFRIGRILLQAILVAVFFHFFGLPAIERFQAREVMKKENCTLKGNICLFKSSIK